MNDLGLLENTYILKTLKFSWFWKQNWWFISLQVEKNHQSWETVLVTKLCLRQKNQKHPLKWKFGTKKMTS